MMIDNRYKLQLYIIELLDEKGTCASMGNVYDSFKDFRKKHPNSSYRFGFKIIDTWWEDAGTTLEDNGEEWYESPEEAMEYYESHLKGYDKPSHPITTTFF